MDKLLNSIPQNWVNQSIGLLFFICGIILGVGFVFLVLKLSQIKRTTRKKSMPIKDVDLITQQAFDELHTSKIINKYKVSAICQSLSILLEEIPKEYDKNAKTSTIISAKKVDLLDNDIKISLDFNLKEGLTFLHALLDDLEREICVFLSNPLIKTLYVALKVPAQFLLKDKVGKNAKDLSLADVCTIKDKILDVVKNANKVKEGVTGIVATLFKSDKDIEKSKPLPTKKKGGLVTFLSENGTINGVVNTFVCKILLIFSDKLNLLYSHSYLDGMLPLDTDATLLQEKGVG